MPDIDGHIIMELGDGNNNECGTDAPDDISAELLVQMSVTQDSKIVYIRRQWLSLPQFKTDLT